MPQSSLSTPTWLLEVLWVGEGRVSYIYTGGGAEPGVSW